MKQKDFVIAAIRELGGAATLSQLYATTDPGTKRVPGSNIEAAIEW